MSARLSIEEREAAYRRALKQRFGAHCPFKITIQLKTVLCLIENLQLAFRQADNVGPSREEAERLVRELVEAIDPERGVIYDFLMLGFDSPVTISRC